MSAAPPAVGDDAQVGERSPLRAVAVPAEHGGWGLTLEPVLLGLVVAWSWAGLCIGLAAVLAFFARTPAKLVAVDRRRSRWLPRTRLAATVAAVELLAIGALVAAATATAGWQWWMAVAAAAPLAAVEWWFDIRSRGRRLAPELCGAAGVAGAAAAIVLADGQGLRLAGALWLVLAARSLGAIPFVRAQIMRARRGLTDVQASDVAQLLSIVVAAVAVAVRPAVAAGAAGVVVLAVLQARWARHDPPAVKILGLRQMALGLLLVAVTAAGVRLT